MAIDKKTNSMYDELFPPKGIQVNYSMINPPDLVVDGFAIQEPQALPYRNADECRESMLKVFKEYNNILEDKMRRLRESKCHKIV